MQNANAFPIDVLVYVAGVLVRTSSVNYTYAYNTFPTATVTMPPDLKLFGIGRQDRVPIQIFLKNVFAPHCATYGKYILVFDGEISSTGYLNTEVSREFVINAQGIGNFLQDIHLAYLTSVADVINASLKGQDFAQLNVHRWGGTLITSLFSQGIVPGKVAGELIAKPSQLLQNIAYFLSSGDTQFTGGQLSVIMQFLKKYCGELLKLEQRIGEVPYFDEPEFWAGTDNSCFPILRGLQSSMATQAIAGLAEQGGRRGSLFEFLMLILDNMEYEMSIIGAPVFKEAAEGSQAVMKQMMLKPVFYDAFPPTCNVILPCHKSSVRLSEEVLGVATRIRMRDDYGVMRIVTRADDNYVAKSGLLDFWPRERTAGTEDKITDSNRISDELLAAEDFTGPFLHEIVAPQWLSYILYQKVQSDSLRDYKDRIMKHFLLLKKYERRMLSVDTAFQPFIVPGYPGVVFDSTDENYTFVGHVLTVQHTITKRSVSSSVEMGFARSIEDAMNPLTKIDNTLEVITNSVTQHLGNMNRVYEETIGSNAVQFSDLANVSTIRKEFIDNPTTAYDFTSRVTTTLEQYAAFIGIEPEDSYMDAYGDTIITSFKNKYVDARQVLRSNEVLRDVLKTIEHASRDHQIYAALA